MAEPPAAAPIGPTPLPNEEAKAETTAPPKISLDAPVQKEPPPATKPQPKSEPVAKPTGRKCVRCASAKIIPNVTVQAVGESKNTLQCYVDAVPDALVFKERRRADIVADVCGECGHVALKVRDPATLYYHYLTSTKPR